MSFLLFILQVIAAGWLGLIAFKPLKLSSEMRFTDKSRLTEGLIYLAGAILTLLMSAWLIPFGITAGISYFIKKKNDDGYYLN